MFKKIGILAAAALLSTTALYAASIPNLSFFDPTNPLLGINGLIQSLNGFITPGSMAPYASGRNFLDNGAMQVDQRSAFAVVSIAATTSGPIEATGTTAGSYAADRWAADINMATGNGQIISNVTSTPSPPAGFTYSTTLTRFGGLLLQPVCAEQEIPTVRATQMAGQTVILSIYAQALAGLAADNGNNFNLYLITGTGADQGLGALKSAVGMTTTTKQSSFTISTTTGLITNATTVVAGQPVTMTAATMSVGIVSGQVYYVSTALLNSGTAFAVAPTYAQAIAGTNTVIPATGGTTDVINIGYITPVWTGLAVYGGNGAGQGQSSAAQAYGQAEAVTYSLSATVWNRYSTGPINLPTTVTEAAALICFQPNNAVTAGGATDGIAFTGAQLEIAGPNQTTPSPYEFKPTEQEIVSAYRYAWIFAEPAASVGTPWVGVVNAAGTACDLTAETPVPMVAIPNIAFVGPAAAPTATTFKVVSGATAAALGTPFLAASTTGTAGLNSVGLLATAAGQTAGWGCKLIGAGGSEFILATGDF